MQSTLNYYIYCIRYAKIDIACWRIEGIDMTDTARRSHAQVLAKLRESRGELIHARLAALDAHLHLVFAPESDMRGKRAAELCERISDAIAHVERLIFFVEDDGR
jgi:hypothetical protein